MKFLGIFLGIFACMSIYLSHPNQAILSKALPLFVRYIGAVMLLLSLICLWIALPALVAVFVWCAIITVAWSFLPFIPLFKKYHTHENAR